MPKEAIVGRFVAKLAEEKQPAGPNAPARSAAFLGGGDACRASAGLPLKASMERTRQLLGGPQSGTCHWCDRRGVGARMDARTRRGLMTRAATNVFASRHLRSRCGLAGEVVYNPVPHDTFAEGARKAPRGDRIMGGRPLRSREGVRPPIRAMGQVDAQLVLAGDGPLRGTLEALVAELGWARRSTSLVA